MYGQADAYNSPHSGASPSSVAALFGMIDAEFEAEGDEFGILGIAIGKRARTKKHEKRIGRILGKLKKLLTQQKMDKAKKHAGKLARSIRILGKVSPDWEETPEIEAWVAYAEDGDQKALLEALGGVSVTGEEIDDDEDEGRAVARPAGFAPMYRTAGSGARGPVARRGPPRRRTRLPPGFRPRGYTRMGRNRKMDWLEGHPNAASAPHFADPRSWRRPGIRPAAAHRGRRGVAPSMERPGQAAERRAWDVAARRRGGTSGGGGQGTRGASSRPGRADRRGRRSRFGDMDEEMAGLIGIDAFNNLDSPTGLTRQNVFFEAIGDQAAGDIVAFGLDFDEDFGARGVRYGPFTKKLDAKREAAQRKYQRAQKSGDSDAAQIWLAEYQRIAVKQQEMRAMPELQTVTTARAVIETPIFSTSTAGQVEVAEGRGLKAEDIILGSPIPG